MRHELHMMRGALTSINDTSCTFKDEHRGGAHTKGKRGMKGRGQFSVTISELPEYVVSDTVNTHIVFGWWTVSSCSCVWGLSVAASSHKDTLRCHVTDFNNYRRMNRFKKSLSSQTEQRLDTQWILVSAARRSLTAFVVKSLEDRCVQSSRSMFLISHGCVLSSLAALLDQY